MRITIQLVAIQLTNVSVLREQHTVACTLQILAIQNQPRDMGRRATGRQDAMCT